MKHPKVTKTVLIHNELAQKIREGEYNAGSDFFTTDELMLRYKISSGSAVKILQTLRDAGLLEMVRGHRSKIAAIEQLHTYPVLKKPIGITGPINGPFRMARWRDHMLFEIQRKLLKLGNQPLWLSEHFSLDGIQNQCAGVIYSGELVPEEQWNYLMQNNIPCARISFERPYLNTVFNDFRVAMDQLALHMFRSHCRKLLYVASSEQEEAKVKKWMTRIRLDELMAAYGLSHEESISLVVMPDIPGSLEKLKTTILGTPHKIALLTCASTCNKLLFHILEECGRKMGADYEIYAMSALSDEIVFGHWIDMKCEEMEQKLIDMFFRQCQTSMPQVGEIVYPQFIIGTRNNFPK